MAVATRTGVDMANTLTGVVGCPPLKPNLIGTPVDIVGSGGVTKKEVPALGVDTVVVAPTRLTVEGVGLPATNEAAEPDDCGVDGTPGVITSRVGRVVLDGADDCGARSPDDDEPPPPPDDPPLGAGAAVYVKPPAKVSLPFPVVTTTSAEPTVPAGMVTTSSVVEFDTTVADAPPTVTLVALASRAPVIVSAVPPAAVPLVGLTDVMSGGVHVSTACIAMNAGYPLFTVEQTIQVFKGE